MTMTNSTPQLSHSEFRDGLLSDVGERINATRLAIANAETEINNQRVRAHQTNYSSDPDVIRQANHRIGQLKEEIRGHASQLRTMELERDGIVRGSDARIAMRGLTSGQSHLEARKQSYEAAIARFNELTSPDGELVRLARQIADWHLGWSNPPVLAQAIVDAT